MAELTILSSKGQVVLPKSVRESMHLEPGNVFAVYGQDDTLVLKRVDLPEKKEIFERIHKWGRRFAKQAGLKEEDVERRIHAGRQPR